MSEINFKDGHRQRLKKVFLDSNMESLTAEHYLELLLFYCIPRKDTQEISCKLIHHFGTLAGVLDATFEDLLKVKGIGESTATLIKLIPNIARAYMVDRSSNGTILSSIEEAGNYLIPKFIGYTKEVLYIVCLDNKLKVVYCDILSEGTIDNIQFAVRTIIEITMRVNANSVILAHNHPYGLPLPSADDVNTTIRLHKALEIVGVSLRDHFIIANGQYTSLADSGIFSFKS